METHTRRMLAHARLLWILIGLTSISTQAAQRLLPFQGRLTDDAGKPLADGSTTVQFQIFAESRAGSPLWAGEVHRVTLNGGLLNVTLGSKNPLPIDHPNEPERAFFDSTLYLQITPDADGDGKITDADPPLLPRQAILPVVFAAEAQRARDADRLEGHSTANLPTAIPIGGVVMWWGARDKVPAGFEVCDGSTPSTPGAVLTAAKPDLRNRFPMGAGDAVADVAGTPVIGGSNTIGERATLGAALTIRQMPAHHHRVDLTSAAAGSHRHSITTGEGDGDPRNRAADGEKNGKPDHTAYTNYDGEHTHRVVGNTVDEGLGEAHAHGIPAHDNRPAYLELFFIIRVK